LIQNPKTEPTETRVILGRIVLERRGDDAEKGSHGRADRGGFTPGKAGEKVGDICRKVGISEGTYYAWKK
jgi:transposase